jgi:hemolysin III
MEVKEQITSKTKEQRISKEEVANSITHGMGFILSVIGFVVLLISSISQGSKIHVVCSCIYGASLMLLYLISMLYHAITHEGVKKVFRRLDHISIYLLIAGTYMPLALVVLKGSLGWTVFGVEYGLCFVGVLFKAIFGPRFAILSVLFYLIMGWLAIFTIRPIIEAFPIKGSLLVILGGLFYTLGVIFFALDQKFPFFHAIWHLFVLAGSISHFFMILLYVLPLPV